jgi:hypothetical protein
MKSSGWLQIAAGSILTCMVVSCSSLQYAAKSADWFFNDYAGGRSSRENAHNLTVIVDRSGAYSMAVEVVSRDGEKKRAYVSSSSPRCSFKLNAGRYSVRLRIGEFDYGGTSVDVDSDKVVYLSE